jgi:hypothetical protein
MQVTLFLSNGIEMAFSSVANAMEWAVRNEVKSFSIVCS